MNGFNLNALLFLLLDAEGIFEDISDIDGLGGLFGGGSAVVEGFSWFGFF